MPILYILLIMLKNISNDPYILHEMKLEVDCCCSGELVIPKEYIDFINCIWLVSIRYQPSSLGGVNHPVLQETKDCQWNETQAPGDRQLTILFVDLDQ